MSSDSDDPGVTLVDLRDELAGDLDDAIATVDDAPGEPMFRAGDTASLFALAHVILSDRPGPSGVATLEAFTSTVGRSLSPGTMYPALDALREEGVLTREKLVRSYHHAVVDPEAADARLEQYEQRLRWWLRLCLTAREALDTDADAGTGTDPDADA